jgi:hypothetical protein
MCTALHDNAAFENDDFIAIPNRTQPVRHDQTSTASSS